MTTIIHSNGSKWLGESPDSIETLVDVLGTYVLDRRFESFGNFAEREPRNVRGERIGLAVRFFGNFLELSHVFNIDTDEPAVIERLTAAIRANQQRADYLAQPSPEEGRKADEEYRKARAAAHKEEMRRKAHAILKDIGDLP